MRIDKRMDIIKLTVAFRDFAKAPKKRCDSSNNRGNWTHLRIIQKIPERHTRKAKNQVTTENSYMGHGTHTLKSADIKDVTLEIALPVCGVNSNFRIPATLYSLETWFLSGIEYKRKYPA
jgi:hypothetical protein